MSTTDKPPVFVVGSARSGNTMLYHMLLASGALPGLPNRALCR